MDRVHEYCIGIFNTRYEDELERINSISEYLEEYECPLTTRKEYLDRYVFRWYVTLYSEDAKEVLRHIQRL